MASAQHIIVGFAQSPWIERLRRPGAALLAALALGACSRGGADVRQPQSATPAIPAPVAVAPAAAASRPVPVSNDDARADAWMRTIFQDAYDPAHRQALSTLRVFDYPKPYLMTLKSAAALPDGRFALVLSGAVAPDDSVPAGDAHAMSHDYAAGRFSVYIMQPQDGGWAIAERHESVSGMESNPALCSMHWVSLGAGKPGFAVSSTINGERDSLTVLELFELANGVRQLAELKQGGSNAGECSIETVQCWEVEGIAGVADSASQDGYADLTIDFQGKRFRYSEDDDTGMTITIPLPPIRQATRYRFDGERYELVSGALPAELL